jgi:SAM-dependent methyltransferase
VDEMLRATAATEDRHFWFLALRRHARYLVSQGLRGRPARLIVDCGAGTGRNLDWLASFGPAVGVELSSTGIDLAKRRPRRLVQGSVTHLPFRDGSADIATSFDVLYMLAEEDARSAVAEMWRILAPGGAVVINAAALSILRGSHSAFTHEKRRYSRRSLRALLTAEGFALERLSYVNMSAFPVAFGRRAVERATGRADRPSGAELAVPPAPINAAFDGLLRLEAGWLRIANLPIGTSLMALARKPNV